MDRQRLATGNLDLVNVVRRQRQAGRLAGRDQARRHLFELGDPRREPSSTRSKLRLRSRPEITPSMAQPLWLCGGVPTPGCQITAEIVRLSSR